MIRRTIQSTGGGSYSVTLPKSWVKTHGLGEGDQLLIDVNEEGYLTIMPEKDSKPRSPTSLTLSSGPLVVRDILGGYLLGYDHIIVEAEGPLRPELVDEIRRRIRGLTGAEIIEEAPNRLEVQILLDTDAVEPTKVLTRQNALVRSMISDAVAAFTDGDLDRARRAVNRDEEVDRHYFTLVRVVRASIREPYLARRARLTPLRLMDIRLVAKFLEDIGDKAVGIANIALSHKESYPPLILRTIKQIGEGLVALQQDAFEAFLRSDPELASNVISKRGEIVGLIDRAISSARQVGIGGDVINACLYLDRISEDQVDIADIAAPISTLA